MKTVNKGIDYGSFAGSNKDFQTGIRFGVIPDNDVCQAWCDSSEPDYSFIGCPYCGNELKKKFEAKRCPHCYKMLNDGDFGDYEPDSYILDDGEYKAESDSQGDIFILKSPYYTYAQFCSPCAPGACYLKNELEEKDENNKCYCFGHDFFDEGIAPYTVYSIETGKEVLP